MEHLGWFFAGTSLGLFVGVFLTSLGKMADMSRPDEYLNPEEDPEVVKVLTIRR